MASPTMTVRTVESRDPSLSAEANALITSELRRVIGRESIEVPADRIDHRSDRHARHTAIGASVISVRPLLLLSIGPLLLVGLIGLIGAENAGWLAIAAVSVMLVAGLFLVAEMTSRLFDDHEHMDPEVSAKIQAEGVGDPDRMFTELVEEFRPAPPR